MFWTVDRSVAICLGGRAFIQPLDVWTSTASHDSLFFSRARAFTLRMIEAYNTHASTGLNLRE